MKAIILRNYGGPEELRVEDVTVGAPGAGEVRLRQTVIGINFHDAYVRSGLYKTLALPGIPGVEAAGIVEAVGEGVAGFKQGDRVAYVTGAYGAYASHRLIAAAKLIRLPDTIDDRTAGAMMVKGLTVQMLLTKLRPLQRGETCLIHAAAGGVGQMLTQWAHHLGATVIGTVGNDAKAGLARANGCGHVIVYTRENFAARVTEITGGKGVHMVFDSVGADTFEGSLAVLASQGVLVNFGQSAGPIPPFAPARLAAKSNALWRPILFHYIEDAGERQRMADALFAAVAGGIVKVEIGAEFPLEGAGEAHRAMEARATTGSTILKV
ncbi:MAG: quinone oxidoreductase [Rhodospirillaceae bacterium]|nr:quinone oxidoreductase [Rhodospirillaceae bacterium]